MLLFAPLFVHLLLCVRTLLYCHRFLWSLLVFAI